MSHESQEPSGRVILVPSPIGNLADITFRAIEVLKTADYVLAEDTRQSRKLLQHYGIDQKLHSLHQNNEHSKAEQWATTAAEGAALAYLSDAGTPGISDPGYLLVKHSLEQGVAVECLPGATAFVPALVASGLPCDRFVFEGFLPHKKGRKTRLEKIADESYTSVLYESPHRINKLVNELAGVLDAGRQIVIARELTKLYEDYVRGTVEEVQSRLDDLTLKGEIVVLVAGAT